MQADQQKSNPERERLERQREGRENWRLWGPYLSERAWGTVREDYSQGGKARRSGAAKRRSKGAIIHYQPVK